MRPDRFAAVIADITADLSELAHRQRAAHDDNHPPARRGHTERQPSGTYCDPAGYTATETLWLLDDLADEMRNLRSHVRDLNARLAEWAPQRHWPDGRRCGLDGCARPHHSRGLCDLHRKRDDRRDQRRTRPAAS